MLQLMHRKKSSLHLELISLMFLQHCEHAALTTVDLRTSIYSRGMWGELQACPSDLLT